MKSDFRRLAYQTRPFAIEVCAARFNSIAPTARESADALLGAADEPLYRAKASDRNRYEVFGETPRAG